MSPRIVTTGRIITPMARLETIADNSIRIFTVEIQEGAQAVQRVLYHVAGSVLIYPNGLDHLFAAHTISFQVEA